MFILELYEGTTSNLIGTIGLDDNNEVFVEGLEEDDYMDWLSGTVDDENGDIWEAKDGEPFLAAVAYKLMKNVFEGEIRVEGPFEK